MIKFLFFHSKLLSMSDLWSYGLSKKACLSLTLLLDVM